MSRLLFDIETNGLLPELTKIHCLVIQDIDTGEVAGYADQPGYRPIIEGVERLNAATLVAGHNAIAFDVPALKKLGLWASKAIVRDTMVCAQLMWPHVKDDDFEKVKRKRFPAHLAGRHSLEAWGHRLGVHKGDYTGGWDAWSPEMHDYMMQDIVVTAALWSRIADTAKAWGVPLDDNNPPPRKDCIYNEHRMAEICDAITKHGFRFDMQAAVRLVQVLTARRQGIMEELAKVFQPLEKTEIFVPKVNNRTRGYVKGVPFTKRWMVEFNPGSRQQVAERLMMLGWKPTAFGNDGVPTVDDDILQALPYPQAKLLAEYFVVQKRLGQIVDGKEAWFRHERKGRIHGRITPNGAHTGRATHSGPNMGQVPKVGVPYGAECRDLFLADDGHILIGTDADALELRDLAGFMAMWDGGAYIKTILEGRKEDGTDMHSINAKLIGCTRDVAKTFFYAMAYGSGDQNLGVVLGYSGRKAAKAGREAKAKLMEGLPALGKLVEMVAKAVERGYLIGLDGRRLTVRSENAALNTLLQSAGAVQCKRWIIGIYDKLTAQGLKWGTDWAICMWVHDELQISANACHMEVITQASKDAMKEAGEFYSFKCPLVASVDVGMTWKETH